MKVQDVMTRKVETCSPDTDLAAAAMMMWRNDCGVVPVTGRDGKVAGMITDRDICMAVATRHQLADQIRVEDVMSGMVHTVQSSDDVGKVLERMRSERIRRLPVTGRDGKLAGIVSINDLVLCVDSTNGKDGLSSDEVMAALKSVCEHSNGASTVS